MDNNNSNPNNNDIYDDLRFIDKKDYKTKKTTNNNVLLVLSIFNIITIVPFIIYFGAAWLLFGAFGSESTYYLLLGCCGIYVIASILFFIISIWSVVKHSDELKKIFKIGILVFIVLIIGLFCYKTIFPNSNINISNLNSSINNKNVEIKNNVLLNTDDIEIKVEKIFYTTNYIEIHFNLNNKSNKYYNFHVYKLKVNDYENINFGRETGSNFGGVNLYVEPHNNSSNYVIYIWYNDLKKYNIEKINKLSFNLLLYKSERGDLVFEQEKNSLYYDIEFK